MGALEAKPVQGAKQRRQQGANMVQPLLTDPLSHLSLLPPTSSRFLRPPKVLSATGTLLLPFYLPGVSSPQIVP